MHKVRPASIMTSHKFHEKFSLDFGLNIARVTHKGNSQKGEKH